MINNLNNRKNFQTYKMQSQFFNKNNKIPNTQIIFTTQTQILILFKTSNLHNEQAELIIN